MYSVISGKAESVPFVTASINLSPTLLEDYMRVLGFPLEPPLV